MTMYAIGVRRPTTLVPARTGDAYRDHRMNQEEGRWRF